MREDIDFRRMPRKLAIQAIGIHPETFDHWVDEGCKPVEGKGQTAFYDLAKIFLWRIEKAENSRKPIKKQPKENKPDSGEMILDPEVILREKIMRQDLRKKTLDNDEREGMLVDKKQMEDRYFRLGRALRDNLMSKDSVYGPQLNMVSGFEASVYLRKEFEKFCNSLSDLNILDDHNLALEFNYYFDLGVKYRDIEIKVINEVKPLTYKD